MTNNKTSKTLVIIIDDDDISNLISATVVRNAWPDADLATFINAVEGLAFIQNDFTGDNRKQQEAVLLLNITMPLMTGWEFLHKFDKLTDEIKKHVRVYILSSSVDYRDLKMSHDNKYVWEFLPKPLTTEMVLKVRSDMERSSFG